MGAWTVEATIRTVCRVDETAVRALLDDSSPGACVLRSSGSRGATVLLHVQADTHTAAGSAALALLAARVLPVLEGADLVDLRITAEELGPEPVSTASRPAGT
jgi:hypothetical protein